MNVPYKVSHSLDGWYFWDQLGQKRVYPGKSSDEVRKIAAEMASEERNDWIDDEEPMSLEEASKSVDAAIASTPPSHPDHEALKR
jgi:hypothetical protein